MIVFQTLSHCHKRMSHPISKLKLTGKDKRIKGEDRNGQKKINAHEMTLIRIYLTNLIPKYPCTIFVTQD